MVLGFIKRKKRLAADQSSLNGSYRSKSEFDENKKDPDSDRQELRGGGDGEPLNCSLSFKSSCSSLTWDTLKKIRRQKSRRNTNELKKYQSTVCIYEDNKFSSLQTDSTSSGLKYEEVYRSSPSLCEERSLAATRHLSASRLKFTDWGQQSSLITFNFEDVGSETCYPNYENTIEEHDETAANDDSDSGIDSLYECIKFKTNESGQRQTKPESFVGLKRNESCVSTTSWPVSSLQWDLVKVLTRDPSQVYVSQSLRQAPLSQIDLSEYFSSSHFQVTEADVKTVILRKVKSQRQQIERDMMKLREEEDFLSFGQTDLERSLIEHLSDREFAKYKKMMSKLENMTNLIFNLETRLNEKKICNSKEGLVMLLYQIKNAQEILEELEKSLGQFSQLLLSKTSPKTADIFNRILVKGKHLLCLRKCLVRELYFIHMKFDIVNLL